MEYCDISAGYIRSGGKAAKGLRRVHARRGPFFTASQEGKDALSVFRSSAASAAKSRVPSFIGGRW